MKPNTSWNETQQGLLQLAGLLTKEHWCQGPIAMDDNGNCLADPLDPTATRWCLMGGVHKVTGSATTHGNNVAARMVHALDHVIGGSPPVYNDRKFWTRHWMVRRKIMQAVEYAGQRWG